jgi:hypothetical protein
LFDRCDVDGDGVFDPPRVTARERDDERNARDPEGVDDEPIAAPQPFLRQPQSTELIVLVRIRSGEIQHTLRPMRDDLRQRALELAEKRRVVGAIGQADVERTTRLPHRVVVLLVHREGEHVCVCDVLFRIRARIAPAARASANARVRVGPHEH